LYQPLDLSIPLERSLSALMGIEIAIYLGVNLKLLHHWFTTGKLNTLVNKFMGLNRVYGIIFVFMTIFDRGVDVGPTDNSSKMFYCYGIEISTKFLSIGFWTNNITVALIRLII
jgi:hypothetical protein